MSIRITPWQVLIQAAKNMTAARKGDWGHAFRVVLFLGSIGYGWLGLYVYGPEAGDYSYEYPTYAQLESAQGMLTEVRTRRTSYLVLLVGNESAIPLKTNFTLTNPLRDAGFYDAQHNFVRQQVQIRWFEMPVTKWAWVAELKFKGETLVSYEQRRLDFATSARIRETLNNEYLVAIVIGLVVLVWYLVEAYRQIKKGV